MADSEPKRIQRKRTKGWKMPPNTLCVTRPGRFGNPFKIGGYYRLGKGTGHPGFVWLQALEPKFADATYTLITTADAAVRMFRELRKRYPFRPEEIAELRAADYLACFCRLDQPCHVDVLLEIANSLEARRG